MSFYAAGAQKSNGSPIRHPQRNIQVYLQRIQLPDGKHIRNLLILNYGGVAEWFKAAVLKTAVLVRVPWVRILPPPPLTVMLDNPDNQTVLN